MTPKPPRRLLRAMRRTLAALPDPDYEIFARARFEDQDYRCIAREIGVSVTLVERSLARTLRAIDIAVRRVEERTFCARAGRICAWLHEKLPQGWRR